MVMKVHSSSEDSQQKIHNGFFGLLIRSWIGSQNRLGQKC